MGDIIEFRIPDRPKTTNEDQKPSAQPELVRPTNEEIELAKQELTKHLLAYNTRKGIKAIIHLRHNPEAEDEFVNSKKVNVYASEAVLKNAGNPEEFVDNGHRFFIFTDRNSEKTYRVCFPPKPDSSIDFRISSIGKQVMKITSPTDLEPKKKDTRPKLRIV